MKEVIKDAVVTVDRHNAPTTCRRFLPHNMVLEHLSTEEGEFFHITELGSSFQMTIELPGAQLNSIEEMEKYRGQKLTPPNDLDWL